MSAKDLIILITLSIVVIAFGFGLGVLFQIQQGSKPAVIEPQVNIQTMPQVIKDLSSKVVPSMSANGIVTKIDGRNITLSQQGDSMVIPVRADASVYSFISIPATPLPKGAKPAPAPSSKLVAFTDIKTGDNLSISIKVLPTGKIEGLTALILPSASVTAPAPTPK